MYSDMHSSSVSSPDRGGNFIVHEGIGSAKHMEIFYRSPMTVRFSRQIQFILNTLPKRIIDAYRKNVLF